MRMVMLLGDAGNSTDDDYDDEDGEDGCQNFYVAGKIMMITTVS